LETEKNYQTQLFLPSCFSHKQINDRVVEWICCLGGECMGLSKGTKARICQHHGGISKFVFLFLANSKECHVNAGVAVHDQGKNQFSLAFFQY